MPTARVPATITTSTGAPWTCGIGSPGFWARRRAGSGGDLGGRTALGGHEAGGIALTDRARQLQSWGYPIRLVDPAQVHEMEPDLAAGTVTAATHTEIEGHVDTGR